MHWRRSWSFRLQLEVMKRISHTLLKKCSGLSVSWWLVSENIHPEKHTHFVSCWNFQTLLVSFWWYSSIIYNACHQFLKLKFSFRKLQLLELLPDLSTDLKWLVFTQYISVAEVWLIGGHMIGNSPSLYSYFYLWLLAFTRNNEELVLFSPFLEPQQFAIGI